MSGKKSRAASRGSKKAPSPDAVRSELERILVSPDFEASQRSKDILRFVVEETLSGRKHMLKGYTIATQVLGRGQDFDPILDPIIRIEVGKLRRALERFYLLQGGPSPLRIVIPKGTNVPTFREQFRSGPDKEPGRDGAPGRGFEGSWPSVIIRHFDYLTGDPQKDYLGLGLATELATELSRFQDIKVLLHSQEGQARRASDRGARFIIEGNIREDKAGVKWTVNLIDTTNRKQIWSDTYRSGLQAARVIAFQERIANEIAAKIAGECGVIAKALSQEAKDKPPSQLKTYEAVLRYYEYYLKHTPDSFQRALAALEHAIKIEPECGQVWCMLGRMYANIFSLEFPGFETALEKARAYSERGVQLSPENQLCRCVLAQVLMFSDETEAALIEVNRALALNPSSLFMLDGIGYLLTLLGEWERGPNLIREVMRRNPFYNLYVHYALWADWIRREDYEKAHLEAFNFRRPSLFWEPLMQAVNLGQLGRFEEGRQAAENLLRLKPDFPSRGRILIRHYIKFDDIFDRIIEGLGKVGLQVE